MKKLVMILLVLSLMQIAVAQNYVVDAYSNTNPYYRVSRDPYGGNQHRASVPEYNNPSMNIRSVNPVMNSPIRERSPATIQYAYDSAVTQCGGFCNAQTRACYDAGRGDWECKQVQRECSLTCKNFGVSSCDRRCASNYQSCILTQSPQVCYAQLGACQTTCNPEVQRPAPTEETCETDCSAVYQSCLNAGGSVAVCSSGAYDACMQQCPQVERATSNVQLRQGIVSPPDLRACDASCGGRCGVLYEQCVNAGNTDCESSVLSCLRRCSPVVQPMIGPTARVVQSQPSIWESMKGWFR